jgi:hypothetical protein
MGDGPFFSSCFAKLCAFLNKRSIGLAAYHHSGEVVLVLLSPCVVNIFVEKECEHAETFTL